MRLTVLRVAMPLMFIGLVARAQAQLTAAEAREKIEEAGGYVLEDGVLVRSVTGISLNYLGERVDDEFLMSVLATYPKLQSLAVPGCAVTNRSVAAMTRLEELTSLNLRESGITAEALPQLATLKKLEQLNVGELRLSGAELETLVPLKNLRVLSFNTDGFDDTQAQALAAFPRLSRFSTWRSKLTDEGLASLAQLKELEYLEISSGRFSSRGLRSIGVLTKLQTLDLGDALILDDDLSQLGGLSKLTELRFDPTFVTDDGLAHLGRLTGLASLALSGDLSAEGMAHLKKLGGLESLTLSRGRLAPGALRTVGELPALKQLSLSYLQCDLSELGDWQNSRLMSLSIESCPIADDLSGLEGLTSLRSVVLDQLPVTDKGLASIAMLPSLEYVTIDRLLLSGSGFKSLVEHPHLEQLTARNCLIDDAGLEQFRGLQVHGLDLSGNLLTSSSAATFKSFPRLTSLMLSDNDLDDAAVPALVELKQLRFLELMETPLSAESVQTLRKSLMDCTVFVDEPAD